MWTGQVGWIIDIMNCRLLVKEVLVWTTWNRWFRRICIDILDWAPHRWWIKWKRWYSTITAVRMLVTIICLIINSLALRILDNWFQFIVVFATYRFRLVILDKWFILKSLTSLLILIDWAQIAHVSIGSVIGLTGFIIGYPWTFTMISLLGLSKHVREFLMNFC